MMNIIEWTRQQQIAKLREENRIPVIVVKDGITTRNVTAEYNEEKEDERPVRRP